MKNIRRKFSLLLEDKTNNIRTIIDREFLKKLVKIRNEGFRELVEARRNCYRESYKLVESRYKLYREDYRYFEGDKCFVWLRVVTLKVP
jgi:hypothetical protein